MADPEAEDDLTSSSLAIIRLAREERDGLLRLIEESQRMIDRSLQRIAQLDRMLRDQ